MERILLGWVMGAASRELPKCQELCSRNADCIEQELASFEVGWQEWTGFPDRSTYESERLGVFERSLAEGALQQTCRAELSTPCSGSGSP